MAKALVKFVKNICRAYVLIDGEVIEVNDNFTVDIKVQGITYSNVPTKVLINAKASIYEVPVLGTKCLVKWRDGNRGLPQIDSFHEIDKNYIVPTSELYLKSPKIQFNDGDKGGLVLVNDLITRMNKIESNQNDILTALKGIVTIPSTPYPFGVNFASITSLTPTTAAQIQNPNITQ